jgi:hypothetical protein
LTRKGGSGRLPLQDDEKDSRQACSFSERTVRCDVSNGFCRNRFEFGAETAVGAHGGAVKATKRALANSGGTADHIRPIWGVFFIYNAFQEAFYDKITFPDKKNGTV